MRTLNIAFLGLICLPSAVVGQERIDPAKSLEAYYQNKGEEPGHKSAIAKLASAEAKEREAALAWLRGLLSQALQDEKSGKAPWLATLGAGTLPRSPLTESAGDVKKRAAQPEAKPSTPRTDLHGDPLPPGAVMRLGTLRHRYIASGLLLADGKSFVSSTNDEIWWMDKTTGRLTDAWPLPKGLRVAGFAPDGRLALLRDDKLLRLWDLSARKEVRTFESKQRLGPFLVPFFAADSKIMVTSSFPSPACVWEVSTGRLLWELDGFGGRDGQSLIGFLADGQTLVTRDGSNNRVSLRDRMTGRVLRSFATLPPNESRSWGLSHDGKAVLIGTSGTSVRVFDVATGDEQAPLGGHKEQANIFGCGRDGRTVLTGGYDPFVLVWDWPAGKLRRKIELGDSRPIFGLAVSPDGKRAEITIFSERVPRCFDLETGKELLRPAEAHNGQINGMAIAPDGRLVSTGNDNTIRVWDMASGRQLHVYPTGHPYNAHTLALSADGRLVATAGMNNGTVRLHERDTGRLERAFETGRDSVGQVVAVNSPGRQLLAATEAGNNPSSFGLFDIHTGQEVRRVDGGADHPAFSPDGQLRAATVDGQPKVWDLDTGLERPLQAGKVPRALAFSPDGRILAGAGFDRIILWEMATGQECCRIEAPAHSADALRFSPDGHWLARADGGAVQVLDVLRGRKVHTFRTHLTWVSQMDFTLDGRRLASSSYDTTILIWDMAAVAAPPEPPARPDAAAVESAMRDLGGADANAAYKAIRLLVEAPAQAVPILRERLKPAVKDKQIRKWIEEVDSSDFETRQAATVALVKGGGQAEYEVRQALRGNPSLEARRRLEGILSKLWGAPAPEMLRVKRAVQILERIGSPEARAVLETLAHGAPAAWETRDAWEALGRLAKRAVAAGG